MSEGVSWRDARSLTAFFLLVEYGLAGFTIEYGGKLLSQTSSSCVGFRFLGVTLTVIGVVSLVMFYVGFAITDRAPLVSLCKSLLCYFTVYLAVAALAIFAVVVSGGGGGGKSLPGRSYKEYSLSSYSTWMQNKVNDTNNWDLYKKALVKDHVCSKFTNDYQLDTLEEFLTRELSPFESGCCKPPDECNFKYTSPAIWTMTTEKRNYSNNDCYEWNNDLEMRCFNCQSCKGGFLQDLTTNWFWTAINLFIVLATDLFVIICLLCIVSGGDSSGHYDRVLS